MFICLLWLCVFGYSMMEETQQAHENHSMIEGQIGQVEQALENFAQSAMESGDCPDLRGVANVPQLDELHGLVHGSYIMLEKLCKTVIGNPLETHSPTSPVHPSTAARQAAVNNIMFAVPAAFRVADSVTQVAVSSIEDRSWISNLRCPTRNDIQSCPANSASCCFTNKYRILGFCCSLPCYVIACLVMYVQLRAFFTSPPFTKN